MQIEVHVDGRSYELWYPSSGGEAEVHVITSRVDAWGRRIRRLLARHSKRGWRRAKRVTQAMVDKVLSEAARGVS